MSLFLRFCSIALFIFVVGIVVVSVARKLAKTKPTPMSIKILNANETYKFGDKNARKAR